jgi:hypothetical protein
MNNWSERFHQALANITDEEFAAIDARLDDPDYRPTKVEWCEHADPFEVDWEWAEPSPGEAAAVVDATHDDQAGSAEVEPPIPPRVIPSMVADEPAPGPSGGDLLRAENRLAQVFTFESSSRSGFATSLAAAAADEGEVPERVAVGKSPFKAKGTLEVALRRMPSGLLEVTFRTTDPGHAGRRVDYAFVERRSRRVKLWAEVTLEPADDGTGAWEGVWQGTASFTEPCELFHRLAPERR